MTKIKIAYSGYDVISAEHEVADVREFARFLVNKVPTLDDAKKYVTALGDDMFWAPRTQPKGSRTCREDMLFIHMKGEWHFTDDGCDWDSVEDVLLKEAA